MIPVTVEFDDQLQYNNPTHEFWREFDPSLPQYFGKPNPQIDHAWAHLLLGKFPGISADELSQNEDLSFDEEDRYPSTGNFHIALDVFHSLHCLNAVRKELGKDCYSPNGSSSHQLAHRRRNGGFSPMPGNNETTSITA